MPLHYAAVAIRAELQVPQVRYDLSALAQLRAALGDNAFNAAAASVIDQGSIDALNEMLDKADT